MRSALFGNVEQQICYAGTFKPKGRCWIGAVCAKSVLAAMRQRQRLRFWDSADTRRSSHIILGVYLIIFGLGKILHPE